MWLKKIQPAQSLQQRQSESDGRTTPDFFDEFFEQIQVSAVCKILLFCGGIDELKVINERCIATLSNVVKDR